MKNRAYLLIGAAGALLATAGVALALPPVPVQLIVKAGDSYDGSTVSTLNAPFTDGNGKVGFVGALADSRRFIWYDAGPIFYSPPGVTGGESTMGVSNSGQFIYSPSNGGNDSVYTNGGVLLQGTDPVSFGGGWSTFNSRPMMLASGTAYWVGGTATTQGGATSQRHLLRATDPTNPATITAVLSGNMVIDGKTITAQGLNFDYWVSDNDNHYIQLVSVVGPTTSDAHVLVSGTFVAQESMPTGSGDNWQNFSGVSINNLGHYIFGGDTDGPVATDAFIAYNGVISIREGDTLDGITLASGAATRALSISNGGKAAFIWGWGSGATLQEHLFLGEAAFMAGSSRLLSLGDELDVNGDGIPDYVLTDFNASGVIGPGLDLADDGRVFVDVDLMPVTGGSSIQAIIAVPEPATFVLLGLGALALHRRRSA